MSKKKKNRTEKSAKAHDFSHLKNVGPKNTDATETGETTKENRSLLDPIYIYDLKRVLFFIGLIVVTILVLTFLVYKTNAFGFVLNKYGIKY